MEVKGSDVDMFGGTCLSIGLSVHFIRGDVVMVWMDLASRMKQRLGGISTVM